MFELFNKISYKTSYVVTSTYSTSFASAVKLLDRETQDAIYSIYGFVRLADEIVDTFHLFDKNNLLQKFESDYYDALKDGISLNPILNAFQLTVTKYKIQDDLIQAFLTSMKTDLTKKDHNSKHETDHYIYGSAEVVGLMCLRVFVKGDDELYKKLEIPARKLGSAFQKVNFLRDIKEDTEILNRRYFHNSIETGFNEDVKMDIVMDVDKEFAESVRGIIQLPESSRLGVLVAYYYYKNLLKRIRKTHADVLLRKRIRVPDFVKLFLLNKVWIINELKLYKLNSDLNRT